MKEQPDTTTTTKATSFLKPESPWTSSIPPNGYGSPLTQRSVKVRYSGMEKFNYFRGSGDITSESDKGFFKHVIHVREHL
jgi:hypothetical protein